MKKSPRIELVSSNAKHDALLTQEKMALFVKFLFLSSRVKYSTDSSMQQWATLPGSVCILGQRQQKSSCSCVKDYVRALRIC